MCVYGYVVMPEHVHLLVGEPEPARLWLAMQMLKQITSRKMRRAGQYRFWQIRYYDTPLWWAAKRIEKLRYMHRNPVKRGLVKSPEQWKWSSFHHYWTGEAGVVEIESEIIAARHERMGIVPQLRIRR